MAGMRLLPLLLFLAGPSLATTPTPTGTPPSAGITTTNPRFVIDTGVEAKAANGLVIRADLRDEYIVGSPILVEITVRNDGKTALTGPDIAARRHLVRFALVNPEGTKTERFSTPPAFDTGGDWTLAPGGRRSVLFEVPNSRGLPVGSYSLTLHVEQTGPAASPAVAGTVPAGTTPGQTTTSLPTQPFQLVPARPLPGRFPYEPAIARTSGASLVWTQAAQHGFDVYLDRYAPGSADVVETRHRLLRTTTPVSPMQSRAASSGIRSRHLYWMSADNEVRLAKLEGTRLEGAPRALAAPWPKVEPMARGVTDGKGGFSLPIWVPAPKGEGGMVRVLCADERGGIVFRVVADFPSRPPVAETSLDAAGNLLLALGHSKGLDLYRVDAAWPPELPASGKRAWKPEGGWTTSAADFASVPDSGPLPGGLTLVAVQTLASTETTPAKARTLWVDLAGKIIQTGTATDWLAPTRLLRMLADGYETPRVLAIDNSSVTWLARAGTAPIKLGNLPDADLWLDATGNATARWVAGENIVSTSGSTVLPTP